jgi:hypothetical protein
VLDALPEWPKRVAPETIDSGRAIMQTTIELPEDIAERLESRWKDLPRVALAIASPNTVQLRTTSPRCPAGRID